MLGVLLFHLPGAWERWPFGLRLIGQAGWAGVDLFFVLSGYLVGGLLIRDYPDVAIGRFLLRRALEIYPSFYIFLAVFAAASWRVPHPASAWWSEVLFLQSYVPGVNGPSWSLAVEEHFYLLLAGLVWVTARHRARLEWLWGVALLVGIADLVLRTWSGGDRHASHLRLDGLFYGVSLAVLVSRVGRPAVVTWARRWRWGLWALALAGGAFAGSRVPWMYGPGFTFVAVAAVAAVLLALSTRGLPWLARLGRDSYSIYLWHGLVYAWAGAFAVPREVQAFSWLAFVILPTLSLAIGTDSARLMEWPVLRWRDRRGLR